MIFLHGSCGFSGCPAHQNARRAFYVDPCDIPPDSVHYLIFHPIARACRSPWPPRFSPMPTIPGPLSGSGDRISRRSWLRIGGLALGGLALPDILRAEAVARSGDRATTAGNPAKGIIMVLLPGGPTHLDTFDPKPDAPAEIRGEFRPIPTNVPGIDLCEHLPRLARMADKLAVIRSLVGFRDDHNTHWCSTGWESHPAMDSSPAVPGFPPGDWPSLGAVLSRTLGPQV